MRKNNDILATSYGNSVGPIKNTRKDILIWWLKSLFLFFFIISSVYAGDKDDNGNYDTGGGSSSSGITAPVDGTSIWIGQSTTFSTSYIDSLHPPTWYFGDGASVRASSKSCTHTYVSAGTYTVRLVFPTWGGDRHGDTGATYSISVRVLPAPAISSFAASPASIISGQSTTLSWSATGTGVSYSLDQGIGAISGTSRTVSPTLTTTYTLQATNNSGSATSSCTVMVNHSPALDPVTIPAIEMGRVFSVVLPAVATDLDGDAITYTTSGLPNEVSFESSTRLLRGYFSTPGNRFFSYIATDAKGASSFITVTLVVNARTVTQNHVTNTVGYAYDDGGRLTRLTYPDGRMVAYTYDALDRVIRITSDGQDVVSSVVYDAWGNQAARGLGSGARDEWTYDTSGMRVSQWAFGPVNGTPEVFPYSYDAADRLTRAGEWDTLTYDTNSRLTRASGFGLENTLAHDAYNNNISSVTTSAGIVPDSLNNFTFNPIVDNHLPSLAANGAITQVSEDNFGEITNVGTAIGSQSPALSMTWDGLGRMTSTTIGATGAVESHGYAASGLRVSRIDSRDANLNRIYAYTGAGHLLAEYTASPTPAWTRDIVYMGDLAIAEIDSNGTHELHADHQGTPRIITGSSGAVEGRLAYGPYGELLKDVQVPVIDPATNQQKVDPVTGNPVYVPVVWGYLPLTGYTGHLQTEPTGLIYMRGRFYSPSWHRFMNSNQGVDPNLINNFAYTIGSPLRLTDPTGMDVRSPGYDATPNEKNRYVEFADKGRFWCGYDDPIADTRPSQKSNLMGKIVRAINEFISNSDPVPSANENINRISTSSSSPETTAINAKQSTKNAIVMGSNLAKAVGPLPGAPMIGAGRAVVGALSVVDDPTPENAIKAGIGVASEVAGVSNTPESIKSVLENGGKVTDNLDRLDTASGADEPGNGPPVSENDDEMQ